MYKAKADLRYGKICTGSERWQRQLQQCIPRPFLASGVIQGYQVYQRMWAPYVGEKATTVNEPGNEHDQSASNAVMQSKCAME